MSENIEIKVTDSVAPTIEGKITRIGSAARESYSAIEKLQNMLKTLDASPLNRLAAAADSLSSASARAASNLNTLTTAQARAQQATAQAAQAQQALQIATVNLSTAQQRLQTATTNSATANQKLQAATTGTATAQQKLLAATANTTTAQNNAAISAINLKNAQEQANASTNRVNTSMGGFVKTLIAAAAAYVSASKIIQTADAYTVLQNKLQNVAKSMEQVNVLTERLFTLANDTRTNVDATATAFTRFDRALANMGKSQEDSLRLTETVNKALVVGGATATEAASALLQLSQAFNAGKLQGDEFRSLAENMPIVLDAVAKVMNKPIDQVKKLSTEGKITAQVLFDAFKSIEKQIDNTFNKTTPTVSQAFTVLNNNFTQFIGKIDKATGLSAALAGAIISIANALKDVTPAFSNAENTTTQLIKGLGELAGMLWGTLVQAFDAVASVVVRTFELFGAQFDSSTTATKFFEAALKAAVVVLQTVIVIASDVIFVFKMVALEIVGIAQQLWALANLDFSGFSAISDAMKTDAERARKELDDFQARVMKIGQPAFVDDETRRLSARSRATQATAPLRGPGPNRTGGIVDDGKSAEKRAAALLKVNTQLDNEIDRLNMLKPTREAQQKLDQIEEQLLGKKIKLNDTERASILSKIQTIQQQARTQSELDRIYEESTGPILAYNATLAATEKLIKAGALSQKEANGQQAAALEQLLNARDPMREANRDLQQQFDLLKLLPAQRTVEQQVQQLIIDQLAKKNPLSKEEIQLYRDKLTVLQQMNEVSQAEGQILSDTVLKRKSFIDQLTAMQNLQANAASGFTKGDAAETTTKMITSLGLDPAALQIAADANVSIIKTMYDQVAQLQANGLITEQDSSNLRLQIWQKEQAGRLDSSQKFFGSLAGLQSSSNKKLAAVGKAAAIANAMIDTYKSATGAYASLSAIPYVGPALGAAAAGAAIAAGLANVAQIRSQNTSGFMSGGYTGDVARTAVAGAVHGQEFVFDAPAVDRIGVQQLESIRSGGSTGEGGAVNVSINNQIAGADFEVNRISAAEVEIIARRVARQDADRNTAANFNNPNSQTFKALTTNTQTVRSY